MRKLEPLLLRLRGADVLGQEPTNHMPLTQKYVSNYAAF